MACKPTVGRMPCFERVGAFVADHGDDISVYSCRQEYEKPSCGRSGAFLHAEASLAEDAFTYSHQHIVCPCYVHKRLFVQHLFPWRPQAQQHLDSLSKQLLLNHLLCSGRTLRWSVPRPRVFRECISTEPTSLFGCRLIEAMKSWQQVHL